MASRLILSWTQVAAATAVLIEQVRCDPSITNTTAVLAVPRGGLLAASMLAYALDCPCFLADPHDTSQQSSRSDLIVVDDICDTGLTFRAFHERFPHALYTAVFVKPAGLTLCDYYGEEVPQDTWLVMPYAPNDIKNRP